MTGLVWLWAAAARAGETGALIVNVAPPDVEVRVDGQVKGVGPARFSALPVGTHNVSLALQGYTPEERVVEILSGGTACVSVTLTRAPKKGPDPTEATAREAHESIVAGVVAGAAASAAGRPPLEMRSDPRDPLPQPEPSVTPVTAQPGAPVPPPWEVAAPCP